MSFLVVKFLEGKQIKKLVYVLSASVAVFILTGIFIVSYEAKLIPNNTIRLIDTIYLLLKSHDLEQVFGIRWSMYQKALQLFGQRKLLGIGWFQYMYYDVNQDATHNIYLQLLCETGIVGFLLFMIPILTVFTNTLKLIYRAYDDNMIKYLRISLYMQTFFLVYGITGNPLYDHNFLFAYFWAVAMYEMCVHQIDTRAEEKKLFYYIMGKHGGIL